MTSVRTLPEAEDELSEAAEYYEARRPGLGIELVLEVDDALERVATHPRAFPRWRDDRPYRKYVLQRFPFVVYFVETPRDDEILVVAIAHSKRRPGYWLSRITDDR